MTISTATRALTTRPSAAAGWAVELKRAWGTLEVTANPAPLDTFIMCKLPKGAMIVGGALLGDKIDCAVATTACLTVNLGVDKAVLTATGTTVTAASTSTALGTAWALGPDVAAVTGYKPDTGRNQPLGGLLLTDGPLLTSDECNAVISVVTSGQGIVSGTLTMFVDYYMAQHS